MVVDQNTIKIICTVPQGASLVNENIKEIYIFAKDNANVDFLFALGQPTETIRYDKDGSTSLELQISLVNSDLTSNIVFNNTQATELAEHEVDPNAHPEIVKELARHGMFIPAGAYAYERRGQSIEYPVEFDGTKATFTHDGVVFTATYNGTELNGLNVVFDGVKTTDQIRAAFNAINYPNTIEHNGTGSEVLASATMTLAGGTYLVDDKDFVYKDTDGVYKQALADGSSKSRVAGWVIRDEKLIVTSGMIDLDTGLAINETVYLSGSIAGKITSFNTNITLGICLGDYMIFTGFAGDITSSVSQEFDAVVANAIGVGQYSTTQAAINAIPNNGRILISKLEEVKETIDTLSKNFTIVFNNHECGWKRFLGLNTEFALSFSGIPTQGTFRFEWNGQESNDIPWNATALDIQTEFNLFNGHNGVTVTGDFINGFVIAFSDNQTYPLPTFLYAGRNEIQKFEFSAVPDNGTIRFKFKGEETVNFAFNDTLAQLQDAFDNLSVTNSLVITGDYATGFTIEFTGGYLQDGNQEQPLIQAVTDYLYSLGVQVDVNGTTTLPINANRIQSGKKPASNLYDGTSLLSITATLTQVGEPVGPDRLMNVNNSTLLISGNGKVEDFTEGFNVASANSKLQFQGYFVGVTKPFLTLDKLPGIEHRIDSFGFAPDINAQLRLTEHPTNKKRVVISGVDFTLPNGITLIKELNNFKVKFTGAEIDFSTGTIYSSDGVTVIGENFIAPVITPTYYKWFSVNILFSSVDPIKNEAEINFLIIPASGEGTTKELAPKAVFGDNPVGLVAIKGALGNKEKTLITTVKDSVTHRLAGTSFILYHPLESVGFYFDNGSGVPASLSATDRQVAITTLVEDDYQATVAQKIQAVIDADIRFTASVIGNKVTVENADLGNVADADMLDTGFFSDILVQGTDTDSTGIEDISNYDLEQLSLGSGGSGGTGDANSFTENLKHRLNTSYYNEASSVVFQNDGDTYVDPTSTGSYGVASKSFEFDNAGDILLTNNLFSDEFLSTSEEGRQVEVYAEWVDDASRDGSAIVSASLDNSFETITMSRIGNSNLYFGSKFLANPANSNIVSQAVTNQSSVLTNAVLGIASKFTISEKKGVRELQLFINKTGSPLGYYTVKLYSDNSGSIGDLLVSSTKLVSDLSVGLNSVLINDFKRILASGDYWISIEVDSVYSASYSVGVNEISAQSSSLLSGNVYNGSTWSSTPSYGLKYAINGHSYNLQLKVQSSASNKKLKAIGVLFNEELSGPVDSNNYRQVFVFYGSENKVNFHLTKFIPDADKLKVYDANSGQVYVYPAFSVDGRTVTFPSGTFQTLTAELITLRFEQVEGSVFDNSDTNANLLATNHLGSNDPTIDKSIAGRGIILRRPDGTLRELIITNSDTVSIIPVV